jgi:hypothetical protein
MSANPNRFMWSLMAACAMAAVVLVMASNAHAAGPRGVQDAFTATTANMTPAGLNLRIQILEWQEADARAEVVAALAAGSEGATPLAKLPTVGYVWPSGSPVGYSVKYSYREPQADGRERITLVTDRRLGSYDFKGWSAAAPAATNDAAYSVVVLELDDSGNGSGTLSLAAEVLIDEAAGAVALKDGAPSLLTNVKREPAKP